MYVVLYPSSPSMALTSALLSVGYHPVPVGGLTEAVDKEPDGGWACAIVDLSSDAGAGMNFSAKAREELSIPSLLVVDRTLTDDLRDESGFDDFILTPIDSNELRVRLMRLGSGPGDVEPDESVLRFRDLELNTATYQATIGGSPTDLTYMEYELLRFLVENPNRVWSREQILSKVWGYDYFGGSRTVDVHIRRLRAKLGEERAGWITTVRSVGYRFG